jgi:hypothetical protein
VSQFSYPQVRQIKEFLKKRKNVAFSHKKRQQIGQKNGLSFAPSFPKEVQISPLSIAS